MPELVITDTELTSCCAESARAPLAQPQPAIVESNPCRSEFETGFSVDIGIGIKTTSQPTLQLPLTVADKSRSCLNRYVNAAVLTYLKLQLGNVLEINFECRVVASMQSKDGLASRPC